MITICDKIEKVKRLPEGYKTLIGVSSDSLLIVNLDMSRIIEWIIKGDNNDGVVIMAETLDEFLDTISLLKEIIVSKKNPFKEISILKEYF